MVRYIVACALILAAALSRLLPHLPNVAPITAIALFGAVYLDRRLTFVVPLIAMAISDYFIGFHSSMLWVYTSFLAIGALGLWLRKHQGVLTTVAATVTGSVIFYLVTNFGVWLGWGWPLMYAHDLNGLIECYTMAIPFFRNTLLGDLAYVGVLFGLFEAMRRLIPAMRNTERLGLVRSSL